MTKFTSWKYKCDDNVHQTMIKTPAKFQKDRNKTVGIVVLTKYPLSVSEMRKMRKNDLVHKLKNNEKCNVM